jgi:hypothetical protein
MGISMPSLFRNSLTLILALAVFAFAAFALHVNLTSAQDPAGDNVAHTTTH